MESAAKKARTGPTHAEMEISNHMAKQLQELYPAGAAPPQWSFDMHKRNALFRYQATCYRVQGVTRERATQLLQQREPVNIAMHRDRHGGYTKMYDAAKLKENFGIEQSGYSKVFGENGGKLPGNIAVYCQSPVEFAKDRFVDVHIMNLIGLAFDDPAQPDTIFFKHNMLKDQHRIASVMSDGNLLMALWNHFVCMWDMAYKAAVDNKLKAVCLARISGGAFGGCLPDIRLSSATNLPCKPLDLHFKKTLGEGKKWNSLYEFVYQETNRVVATSGRYMNVQTVFCNFEEHPRHANLLSAWARSQHNGHRVPACFGYLKDARDMFNGLKLDEVLFLNAWDPHSIAGNGNGIDNSLDGFFGRASAIGLICCPHTNPNMQYIQMPQCSEYITEDVPFIG